MFALGIVPASLGRLKALRELRISHTPIVKVTDQLTTLKNLSTLDIFNCSLTTLPDLSDLDQLVSLQLAFNKLTHLTGLSAPDSLSLVFNLFETVPVLRNPEKLMALFFSYNPIKTMAPISLYKNLRILSIRGTNITSIPSTIDQLQYLSHVLLCSNKIKHIPTNMLNLPSLVYLNISRNALSADEIQWIGKALKKTYPNLDLYI